ARFVPRQDGAESRGGDDDRVGSRADRARAWALVRAGRREGAKAGVFVAPGLIAWTGRGCRDNLGDLSFAVGGAAYDFPKICFAFDRRHRGAFSVSAGAGA